MKLSFILFTLAFASVGCAQNTSSNIEKASKVEMKAMDQTDASLTQTTARYKITFTSLWTKEDHIFDLPRGAHFSPLVVTSHSSDYTLVPKGGLAGPGLELVSELGRTEMIEDEIADAKSEGSILNSLITSNQFIDQELVRTETIEVNLEASLVSLVSMIAPSPDWIVALDSIDLSEGSSFVEDTGDIMLFAYNAGTESGDRGGNFTITNPATTPQAPISMLLGQGFDRPFAKVRLEKIN